MTTTPGRGRPRVGQRVTVRLPPELLRDVDRLAASAGMTRAAYLRALIAAALPAEDVDRSQIRRMLRLTPAERIAWNDRTVRKVRPLGEATAS
ncbi:ribbon-helix-helix protein, CopG family [Euzebya tangerina]|uniref:ribbon-helix-helix protein, CopG family n=1 Tax=Euzebya tangerina TaxID=591198 RepID=UPI000E31A480|nr:ribbon-helix-helix protein, CopG family [Euzebya tangerina]